MSMSPRTVWVVTSSLALLLALSLLACKRDKKKSGLSDYAAVAKSCLNADIGGAKFQMQLGGTACLKCCARVKQALEDGYPELASFGGRASFGDRGRCRCHVPAECPGWKQGSDCMVCCEKNGLYVAVEGPARNAFVSRRGGADKSSKPIKKWNRCYCKVLYPPNE